VLYERIMTHIINNNILLCEQFGFVPKSSSDKASYNLINEILKAFNNKRIVGGIFWTWKRF
jgi:hypothetical protein